MFNGMCAFILLRRGHTRDQVLRCRAIVSTPTLATMAVSLSSLALSMALCAVILCCSAWDPQHMGWQLQSTECMMTRRDEAIVCSMFICAMFPEAHSDIQILARMLNVKSLGTLPSHGRPFSLVVSSELIIGRIRSRTTAQDWQSNSKVPAECCHGDQ